MRRMLVDNATRQSRTIVIGCILSLIGLYALLGPNRDHETRTGMKVWVAGLILLALSTFVILRAIYRRRKVGH